MSTVIRMPHIGDPPGLGRVIKVHRMGGHYVDIDEPLVDVLLDRNVLTIRNIRDGKIVRMYAWIGGSLEAGAPVVEISEGLPTNEVFVAYRRADSPGHAGRIGEWLIREYGQSQVFKDLESLPPGQDFLQFVREMLQRTVAMVVMIGPRWLSAIDGSGVRRIDNSDDLHREEIRTALRRGVSVFPVLVDGARMPTPDELPEDIRQLARHYAIEITDSRWEYDIGRLCKAVTDALWRAPARTRR